MIKFRSEKIQKWVVLFCVSLVGGIITKLPYLKDTYFSTLESATGWNYDSIYILGVYG